MNLIKPNPLKQGDTIGILATSGAVENKTNVIRAKEYFENKGYNVVLSDNAFSEYLYLSGNDDEKIKALHSFFDDKTINAIVCMRGGYGAIRLLNKIDYNLIKNNPKIFAGYSDISALSAMFLKKANLVTFSAPLAQSDFGVENVSTFTEASFFRAITTTEQLTYTPSETKIYFDGEAEGITFGGNLATITSLCGLDFIPNQKFIFFAEDLNEPVYKIDKMFTQLLNIPQFEKKLAGIILGEFLDVDSQELLDDFFNELASKLQKPMIGTFKITHNKDKITIPYGEKAIIKNNSLIVR